VKVSSAWTATRTGLAGTGGAGLNAYPERWQWQPTIRGHERPPLVLDGQRAIAVGGIVASGTVLSEKLKVFTPSGGAVASGAAATGQLDIRAYVPAGGAVTGGAATTSYLIGGTIWSYTPSGTATTGGAATTLRLVVRTATVTGGAVTGGAATTTRLVVRTASASGGIVSGGAATPLKVKAFVPSGGAVADGAATTSQTDRFEYVGVGGAVLGGSASLQKLKVFASTGTATASGNAPTQYQSGGSTTWEYLGSGAAAASGAASTFLTSSPPVIYVSPGPFVGFDRPLPRTFRYVGSGTIGRLGGWGWPAFERNDDDEVLELLAVA